jgi:hypothetical protein
MFFYIAPTRQFRNERGHIDAEGDYGVVIVSGANPQIARKTSVNRGTSSNMRVFLCLKTRFSTPESFRLRLEPFRALWRLARCVAFVHL